MSRLIRTTSGGFPDATAVRNVAASKSFSVKSSVTPGYCLAKMSTRVVPISSAPPSPGVHGIGSQPYFASTIRVPLMSAAADGPLEAAGLAPVLSPLQAPTTRTRAAPRATVARFVSIDPPPRAALAGTTERRRHRQPPPGDDPGHADLAW